MTRRFPLWLYLFSVLLLLVSGCAAPPPPPTGAMLVVRVMGREPVEALALQISDPTKGSPMASVNGIVHSRAVGRWIDFLFPIPLPPGRYAVSHDNAALAPFQVNFEVVKSAPTYVGRLVVYQDRSRPAILDDRYSEDVLMFREVVVSLRALDIVAQVGNLSPEVQEPPPPPAASTVIEVVPVSEALVAQLPVAAREPFKRYLRQPSPRAFAVNDEGIVGLATGKNVVERALQECAKQGSKRPCRIFSVDQSATVTRQAGAPMITAPSPATPTVPVSPIPVSQTPQSGGVPPAPPIQSQSPGIGTQIPRTGGGRQPSPPSPPPPPTSPVACNPPPANPDFKGWLRLTDIVPDASGSRGVNCPK